MAETQTSVEIGPLTSAMVPAVARIHLDAFNTRLGRSYAQAFVRWFLGHDRSIALVAKDNQGQVVGYALGTLEGFESTLTRGLLWTAIAAVALRPWLVLDPYVFQMGFSRLRGLLAFSPGAPVTSGVVQPAMCLVAIGVDDRARGQGIGARLMESFELRARSPRIQSLKLWVRRDNGAARRLYEKCGWMPQAASEPPTDPMLYRKML
jgi:ribosomal protein S18 acetylase RimI-like enzyme